MSQDKTIKKIILIISSLAIIAGSCGNRQAKTTNSELVREQAELEQNTRQPNEICNKFEVNYNASKELLDIILLLPDSAFSSWTWDIEDRTKWYNEIKSNNFCVYEYPQFFKHYYIKPNTAKFQVVDSYWEISKYKTHDNSIIVITNLSSTANEINAFEIKDKAVIRDINLDSLFRDCIELIKLKDLPQECNEKLDEDFKIWFFTFDFSDENTVEIENLWYKKEVFKDCLKGNSMLYKFNPKTKKFDINKICWKSKNSNE